MKNFLLLLLVLVILATVAGGSFLLGNISGFTLGKFFLKTSETNQDVVTHGPESWKDAVRYAPGGSGPADPAGKFGTDMTIVNHDTRLIAENPRLDIKACFPELSEKEWTTVRTWTDRWGEDSLTRVEWQVLESRCSIVFPGNITDDISQEDYSDLMKNFSGYETWFVSGPEGSEFGRVTYEELMSVSSTINRVHVYGPSLPSMPEITN